MRTLPVLLAVALATSGCATSRAPAPTAALPEAWQAATVPADASWRDEYWLDATDDPQLRWLLEQAGTAEDVAIARARLAEAEAFLRAARAALLPALGAVAGAETRRTDPGEDSTLRSLGATLDAPLDVAGVDRSRASAESERVRAAAADLARARLEARRNAGQLYAALRAAQAGHAAAERQVRAAEESLRIARVRSRAGLDTGLAVAQAQSAYDAARARLPGLRQAETQARLGLEALLAQLPGALAARLAPAAVPTLALDRLFDTPAAVIARRPDVRAAEARLAAAGLDARAARAALWPSVRLSAAFTRTDTAGGPTVGLGTAGLSLAATLFDFGRLDALADAAGARAESEAAAYRRTVAYALAEVEREADRSARAREEALANRDAAASAREQVALARARYASGLSNFLDVLLAERALADAEISQAAAEGRAVDAGVALAAALGLGQATGT